MHEAHYEIGGCAHEFYVDLEGRTIPSAALEKTPDTPVFAFEAGPSLYSGLSPAESPNPLKHSAPQPHRGRKKHAARRARTRVARRSRRSQPSCCREERAADPWFARAVAVAVAVFQMIGEEPEWINYDTWGAHLPEVPEGYEVAAPPRSTQHATRSVLPRSSTRMWKTEVWRDTLTKTRASTCRANTRVPTRTP